MIDSTQSCVFKNWRLISRRWWDHILRLCRGGDFCFGKLGILCLRDCLLKLARFGYYPLVCCSIDDVNFPDRRIWCSWCVFFVFWCLRRYSGYWLRLRSRFRFPVSFWSWSRVWFYVFSATTCRKMVSGILPYQSSADTGYSFYTFTFKAIECLELVSTDVGSVSVLLWSDLWKRLGFYGCTRVYCCPWLYMLW